MAKTPSGGDLGDAFLRLGAPQRFPDLFVARRAQVPRRRGALEIAEVLNERTPRDTRSCDNFGQADRRIQICLNVIDRPLHVARRDRPCELAQSFAVVVADAFRFSNIAKSELRRARGPALTAMPCSMRKARIWLIVAVRRETNRQLGPEAEIAELGKHGKDVYIPSGRRLVLKLLRCGHSSAPSRT